MSCDLHHKIRKHDPETENCTKVDFRGRTASGLLLISKTAEPHPAHLDAAQARRKTKDRRGFNSELRCLLTKNPKQHAKLHGTFSKPHLVGERLAARGQFRQTKATLKRNLQEERGGNRGCRR